MAQKEKKKLPLRARIIAVSLVSTLLGMLLLLAFNYVSNSKNSEKMLLDKARLVATNINISTSKYLSKYLQMLEASSRAFFLDNTSSMEKYIDFLDKEVVADPNILGFSIGFPDGKQFFDVKSAPAPEDNFDSRTRPWYIDTLKANGPIITDTYNDATTKQLVTTLAIPITTGDGVTGVYSVDILVNEMLNELDTYIDKDLGGRLLIYDSNENIILSKTLDFIGLKLSDANSYLKDMAAYFQKTDEPYSFTEINAETNKETQSIAVKTQLTGTDWTVAYIIPREALFRDANKNALIAIILSAVIAVIVMLISFSAITYSLRDLKKFASIMVDASRNNDLTVHIPVESNDELGQIAESMNGFIEQIDKIMHDVHLATVDLSSSNNELAATMEELSATFSEQSQQISSMVGNLEHVNQTSKDTAFAMTDNMKALEGTANRTSEETEKLAIVSNDMNQIQTNTTNLAGTISRLGQSSTEIGNILSVINDIANQTNLLALNAAIEAARAGEAGRGFAVVADEVRKLAERTQHSTGEIESIIHALQAEVDSAAIEINKSTIAVGSGAENIEAVTTEIKYAVEEVTALYDKMKPESEAIESQQVWVQTITDNAMVVASGIEESNSALNEVNITVGHLQERAEKLKTIVERFKI